MKNHDTIPSTSDSPHPVGPATPAPDREAIIRAAEDYAQRGWSVIPVGRDKKALGRWKPAQSQRLSHEEVKRRFIRCGVSLHGVAIVLGDVSGGLYVRDFDQLGSYERWAAAHKGLAETLPTVRTSRGFHVYAKWPDLKSHKFSDGELRANRSYVVAPPSLHPEGAAYEWVSANHLEIPDLDPSLAGLSKDWQGNGRNQTGKGAATHATDATDVTDATDATDATYDIDVICSRGGEERWLSDFIRQCEPGPGSHDDQVWKFIRLLKSRPNLRNAPVRAIRPYVKAWWDAHHSSIVGDSTWAYTWGKAARSWDTAVTAIGDTLEGAIEQARELPLPECLKEYRDDRNASLLGRLCIVLSRRADRTFLLSFKVIEDHMGIAKSSAHKIMEAFMADGLLRLVRKGRFGRNGQNIGSLWKWLRDVKPHDAKGCH